MKYAWIENHRDEYAVSRMCRVLSVSRSGYCQWRVRSPNPRELENRALDARVAFFYRESRRSYGRPRITQKLRQQGECDNAAMENFFKTLKGERIYQVRYDTRARARLDIVDWIEGFYNRVRIHTAIGFLDPVSKERSLLAASLAVRGNEAGSPSIERTSKRPLRALWAAARVER